MTDIIERFQRRLKRIGVEVQLNANYPWIYLTAVNGISIKERHMAEHGFTAFWYPIRLEDETKFSNRRIVFAKIRSMLEGDKS